MSKVYLVGAGPGDPSLLTVKALRLIRKADLIIYDYLANPEHLRYARSDAETICVGKRFRYHKFSQNKINKLIIEKARQGKLVVRLKGGDPYLFGRGGEEALFLAERKIPFEVVPGVTSASGCAAYAGIPLTHREHNSSVTFLTGHRAHDENLDTVNWQKIISLNGTLAIYMGFYNLAKIAERLRGKGMPAGTKIAVVEWGTLPYQKSCRGTLKDIVRRVRRAKLKAPAMIYVGEVVGFAPKLAWYEKLPLFGQKIVITRSGRQSAHFRKRLENQGAQVLEFPTIAIEPVEDFRKMDAAIAHLNAYEWVVFTSVNGVRAFLGRVHESGNDARLFRNTRIASVGRETTAELRRWGLKPDLEPLRYETSALSDEFKKRFKKLDGMRILLARTQIAPPDLEYSLRKLGAETEALVAYRTVRPRKIDAKLKRLIEAGEADWITFTSSSTFEHFVKIIGPAKLKKLVRKTKFASIGPVTSRTIRRYGFKPACEARVYHTEGLADAICSA